MDRETFLQQYVLARAGCRPTSLDAVAATQEAIKAFELIKRDVLRNWGNDNATR